MKYMYIVERDIKYVYIVEGEPISVNKLKRRAYSTWDEHSQIIFLQKQQLINQHNEKPMLKGPLKIKVSFYFKTPSKYPHLNKKPHLKNPTLEQLNEFLKQICYEIIYHPNTIITEFASKKVYDHNPRTEINISQESNEHRN